MSAEVSSALIAGLVSLLGIVISYLTTRQTLQSQHELQVLENKAAEGRLRQEISAKHLELGATLKAQEQQWQESFRAELRRNLIEESTLEITSLRIKLYGGVWRMLKVTSHYEWRSQPDLKDTVKRLVEQLSEVAFSETGMVMSDRSRRLLTNLRSGCAQFLRDEIPGQEVIDRAHMLKHGLRSDLGIIDYEYESDLIAVAASLGKVDDWEKKPIILPIQTHPPTTTS